MLLERLQGTVEAPELPDEALYLLLARPYFVLSCGHALLLPVASGHLASYAPHSSGRKATALSSG